MRQHPINLLPASIKARNRASVQWVRCVAAAGVILGIFVVTATHSRVRLNNAQAALQDARIRGQAIVTLDAQSADLRKRLAELNAFIDLNGKVAFPVPVSGILATCINALPESVTIEQLNLDAGVRSMTRTSPRKAKGAGSDELPPRMLLCEISGFAASDAHIAALVNQLEATPPFQNVNLDFSRTRKVGDRDAREFRLSFRVDLDARYSVVGDPPHAGAGVGREVIERGLP